VQAVAQQLLRALRGSRSQVALARRLGYRANPITDWENGRSFPHMSELFRVARVARINVALAFSRFAPNVPLERKGTGFALGRWMRATLGTSSVSDIARRIPCSRSSLSRWVCGIAEPRVPDFLRFMDCTTGRLPDLVAELVPIETVPALLDQYQRAASAKRVAFDHPWTEALLRVLESGPYAELEHSDELLARCLGVGVDVVRSCLAALRSADLIRWNDERFVVERELTVDTRGGQAALRALKAHWARAASTTIPVGPAPTSIGSPSGSRAPPAVTATTLFEPMPVTQPRVPAGFHAMPRGSPSDSSRSVCGTLAVE
jgi:transcriptional regulator with XRE-family HTH domain